MKHPKVPPLVIIAHPRRQHSHQTAYALQEGRLLSKYYTAFWYNKSIFKKIEKVLPYRVLKTFRKRNFDLIDIRDVITNCGLFSREVISKVLRAENYIYKIYRLFDKWVSDELKVTNFDIFIGYEISSLECFRICRDFKKISVLDLAAEHWRKQEEIWEIINHNPFGDEGLRKKIIGIRDEELSLADYIIAPSDYAKQTLLDAGVEDKKVIKIPYGVNLKMFKPKESYRREAFRILYVGAITIRKGLKYLLEAYKKLALKNSELILVGGMDDGKDLLKQYNGLFKYIPFLEHEELVKHYQDADIFVFPSLLDSFAMVVIEAMACGTPVIVSENTGAKDAVKDGVEGFIIPIMDIERLKEKILFFYENRDKVEEMGKNARKLAEQYTWERYRGKIRKAIVSIQHDKK